MESWSHDTCYLQVKDTKLSWADAEARCQESDAHLAIIKSQATNDEVQKLVHGDSSWIGLSDEKASMTTLHSAHYSEKAIKHRLHVCEQEEGKWKRVDGTNLGSGFSRWKEGAPDGGAEENCAVMQVAVIGGQRVT